MSKIYYTYENTDDTIGAEFELSQLAGQAEEGWLECTVELLQSQTSIYKLTFHVHDRELRGIIEDLKSGSEFRQWTMEGGLRMTRTNTDDESLLSVQLDPSIPLYCINQSTWIGIEIPTNNEQIDAFADSLEARRNDVMNGRTYEL